MERHNHLVVAEADHERRRPDTVDSVADVDRQIKLDLTRHVPVHVPQHVLDRRIDAVRTERVVQLSV